MKGATILCPAIISWQVSRRLRCSFACKAFYSVTRLATDSAATTFQFVSRHRQPLRERLPFTHVSAYIATFQFISHAGKPCTTSNNPSCLTGVMD